MEDMMSKGQYRFERDNNNPAGFIANNRASTDAINALNAWSNHRPDRSFTIIVDEDDFLIAELAWDESDTSDAGHSLQQACMKYAVKRLYIEV